MGITKGYAGSVKAGATPATVGEVKNYSLSETADTVEVSTLGSEWAKNRSTLKRWSGSLSAHFDIGDGGQDELRAAIGAGDTVSLEFYIGGESGAGNVKKVGNAVIESLEITNDVAGIVETSISFTGTGALTTSELI